MGPTLVAIFTAALLLPGIFAARAFYRAGQTREVEVSLPSLSTLDGMALVGAFKDRSGGLPVSDPESPPSPAP